MHYATSWHADGLRWIASLFTGAANLLERNAAPPCEPDPARPARDPEEFLFDVRNRMQNRF
jgi:hypothetical protein